MPALKHRVGKRQSRCRSFRDWRAWWPFHSTVVSTVQISGERQLSAGTALLLPSYDAEFLTQNFMVQNLRYHLNFFLTFNFEVAIRCIRSCRERVGSCLHPLPSCPHKHNVLGDLSLRREEEYGSKTEKSRNTRKRERE